MSYKYQQDILSALHEDVERHIEDKNYIRKGQQDLADMHRCDTKRMASELNETYAKAKAFDDIKERFDCYKIGVKKDYDKDMTGTNLHMLLVGGAVLNHFDEFNAESEVE